MIGKCVVIFDNSRTDISACSKLKSEIFLFENPFLIFICSICPSMHGWCKFSPFVQTLNSSFISSMIASAAGMCFSCFLKSHLLTEINNPELM
jgi:hypothetical protein